jgi:hypothetical protein
MRPGLVPAATSKAPAAGFNSRWALIGFICTGVVFFVFQGIVANLRQERAAETANENLVVVQVRDAWDLAQMIYGFKDQAPPVRFLDSLPDAMADTACLAEAGKPRKVIGFRFSRRYLLTDRDTSDMMLAIVPHEVAHAVVCLRDGDVEHDEEWNTVRVTMQNALLRLGPPIRPSVQARTK